MLTRPKLDPNESGTEVTVERIKPEQRQFFAKTANRTKVSRELSRTYSAMLRPNGVPISFRLFLQRHHRARAKPLHLGRQRQYEPRSHHIALRNRERVSVYGRELADRPFCAACWQWLPFQEQNCPMCESPANVTIRSRRVRGWLGVQRYLHDSEYGIDFLRNGRKIELSSRDLFDWNDGDRVEPNTLSTILDTAAASSARSTSTTAA